MIKIFTIALISLLLVSCSEEAWWPRTRFDHAKWMQAGEKGRYVFVRDLIESRHLNGLTKTEVFDVLGKPGYEDPEGKYMTYVIKEDSEVYFLDIRFRNDKAGKIVEKAFVRSA
jgi:hypothetical protein